MIMTKLIVTILISIIPYVVTAKDWTFRVHRDSVRMISSDKLNKPQWFMQEYGEKNMTNLSFFTSTSFIPPYRDSIRISFKNPLRWPYFCIGDSCVIFDDKRIDTTYKYIVSGFPILIQDGYLCRISRSYFSRRNCPRTAIGVDAEGRVVIYVTTNATLKTLQKKMMELGCIHALNLDGGSSTFLYLNGKLQYSSKQSRTYPNVLVW